MSRPKNASSLALRITLIVFGCLLVSSLFVIISTLLIFKLGVRIPTANFTIYVLFAFIVSLIVGTILAAFVSKKSMKGFDVVRKALNEVAEGNFDVIIPEIENRKYLNEIIRDFNATVQQLKSSEAMHSEFITNFSHELKTPITSINGFAELLMNEDLSEEERKEYAQIIYNESNRLLKLAKNTLLLSKLDGQTLVSEKSIFAFDEMVTNCLILLEKEFANKNVELITNLDKITYYWDSTLLSQVVINLVSNAIKYSKEGGKIEVELHERTGYVFLSVKDNGIGMDEQTKEKVFDRYFQGDSSHKTEGNGLGLAIVKRIVDLCGGKIDVGSTLGEGTFFMVTLPERKS